MNYIIFRTVAAAILTIQILKIISENNMLVLVYTDRFVFSQNELVISIYHMTLRLGVK